MPYHDVSMVPLKFSDSEKALKCVVGENVKVWIPVKAFHADTFPDEACDFDTEGTYKINEWAMDLCGLWSKEQAKKNALATALDLK